MYGIKHNVHNAKHSLHALDCIVQNKEIASMQRMQPIEHTLAG